MTDEHDERASLWDGDVPDAYLCCHLTERDAKFLSQGSPVAVEGRIQSWYQPTEKRGGFNFKAIRVQYLGKPSGPRPEAGAQPSEQEEWTRDYEQAEGSQGSASRAH